MFYSKLSTIVQTSLETDCGVPRQVRSPVHQDEARRRHSETQARAVCAVAQSLVKPPVAESKKVLVSLPGPCTSCPIGGELWPLRAIDIVSLPW
jgi:hypothetical protein